MELADRKGMLLQTCQSQCPSTEFVDWQVFYEMKVNEKEKIDHLFARLAQTIVLANGGKFPDEDLDKWIPKYKTSLNSLQVEQERKPPSPEAIKIAAAREKTLLRAQFGIKKKDEEICLPRTPLKSRR